jgi:hypothetical protein
MQGNSTVNFRTFELLLLFQNNMQGMSTVNFRTFELLLLFQNNMQGMSTVNFWTKKLSKVSIKNLKKTKSPPNHPLITPCSPPVLPLVKK